MRVVYLIFLLVFFGCEKSGSEGVIDIPDGPGESVSLSIDKARYAPGDVVTGRLEGTVSGSVVIRVMHAGDVVDVFSPQGKSWQWQTPSKDFCGYLACVIDEVNGREEILASIGIDVSSEWTRFPRYGFLSAFDPTVASAERASNLQFMNRLHLNGIQFYDWHNKHHLPLPMDGDAPALQWEDIAHRPTSFEVVAAYIDAAHSYNMAAMSYNLIYGAWDDFAVDGVKREWLLYDDREQQFVNKHDLDDNWAQSDILVADPGNAAWQDYLVSQTANIYSYLNFDGWHLDQLGDRGMVFDFDGDVVDLKAGFASFLTYLKTEQPNKQMVLNAVNQFAQAEILSTNVDFAYTEVWGNDWKYEDLATIIKENQSLTGRAISTVLAAYMNYDLANNPGYFNTPSVLFTDAVIFAHGGSHLEMGEHMLGKEYFPNDNLLMRADLEKALVCYYDFMVAYQELLRGGLIPFTPDVSTNNRSVEICTWPPQPNKIVCFGKEDAMRSVIHFINFSNNAGMDWRDKQGVRSYPVSLVNQQLEVMSSRPVQQVWAASPDSGFGAPVRLNFEQTGHAVTLELPTLTYWTMLVLDY